MNKINLPKNLRTVAKSAKNSPMYKIVGQKVIIKVGSFENGSEKFKSLGIHHIGPNGVLCNDLETYITWDKF